MRSKRGKWVADRGEIRILRGRMKAKGELEDPVLGPRRIEWVQIRREDRPLLKTNMEGTRILHDA